MASVLTNRRGRQEQQADADRIKYAPRRRKNNNNPPLYTTFEQAPKHLRDNKFILKGYRANFGFKSALISALKLHNETGNIWSHLIGMCIDLKTDLCRRH